MATEKKDSSLAESRPRRAQAGRNIGKLIDQEQDADDFYKTAYGGFEEESADEEYEARPKFLNKAHQEISLVLKTARTCACGWEGDIGLYFIIL